MDISQMVNQGHSLEALQTEIDICRVLCANCHMRIEKKKEELIIGYSKSTVKFNPPGRR